MINYSKKEDHPMANEIVKRETAVTHVDGLLAVSDLKARTEIIHKLMRECMKEGVHYGTIPGTPAPSLWKPGAEMIGLLFSISVTTEIVSETVTDEEASFHVVATATSNTGQILGQARAWCSTAEQKHRWRAPGCQKEFDMALDRKSVV